MAAISRKRTTTRREDLRQMLMDRQSQLCADVRHRIAGLRTPAPTDVHAEGDDSDADVQQDIDLAMIQLRAEMSVQIAAALDRIDAGNYGDCASCGGEISRQRLEALPFAVRCLACEDTREHDDARGRKLTRDRALSDPSELRL